MAAEGDRLERIRAKAHQLWIDEGCPEGRAEAHWDMATELVAIEENQLSTLKPVGADPVARSPTNEPVEPLLAVKNVGEFPTLTDQGEEQTYPSERARGGGSAKENAKDSPAQRLVGGGRDDLCAEERRFKQP